MTKQDALAQYDAAVAQLNAAQAQIDTQFVSLFANLSSFYNAVVQNNTAHAQMAASIRDLATAEATNNE